MITSLVSEGQCYLGNHDLLLLPQVTPRQCVGADRGVLTPARLELQAVGAWSDEVRRMGRPCSPRGRTRDKAVGPLRTIQRMSTR